MRTRRQSRMFTQTGGVRERVDLLRRLAPTSSSAAPTNRVLGSRWATIRTMDADPLPGEVPAAWGMLTMIVRNDSLTRTVRVNDRVRARGGALWQVKSIEAGPRHVMPDIKLHVEKATS